MFMDAFAKCTAQETTYVLDRLTSQFPAHGFRPNGLIVLKKKLTFYPDALYFDLTQADQHPQKNLSLVLGPHQIYVCQGSNKTLSAFNQNYPLSLDRVNILDYARFYFSHIMGPHGRSRLIDVVEDLQLQEEPTPSLRRALHDKIVPLSLNASLAGGGYQLRGSVLVEQTLFSVFIDINLMGQTQVELGRVLADLLPVNNRALEG